MALANGKLRWLGFLDPIPGLSRLVCDGFRDGGAGLGSISILTLRCEVLLLLLGMGGLSPPVALSMLVWEGFRERSSFGRWGCWW